MVDAADKSNQTKGPIVVHCSAGLGRTGTFILVHSVLQKVLYDYNSNPSVEPCVNIPKTLLAMRNYRPGLIQTEEQYLFCYEAIKDGVRPVVEDIELRKQMNAPPPGNYASLASLQQKLQETNKDKGHYQSFNPDTIMKEAKKPQDHYQAFNPNMMEKNNTNTVPLKSHHQSFDPNLILQEANKRGSGPSKEQGHYQDKQ